jgi:hypothetical protein
VAFQPAPNVNAFLIIPVLGYFATVTFESANN